MIAAVTGGTGFIGGWLVKRLVSKGHSVRILTRRPSAQVDVPDGVEVFQGDLAGDLAVLERFVSGADVLYHCAAEINDSEKMLAANVDGARNLARAAAGKIRHWVQLSSADVYGTHTDGIITEETPNGPVNIYEKSKAEADNVVIEAATKNGFTYSILRPSKVYGPGMRNRVLFQLFSFVDKGLFFFIGRPGASANYIHVDDVVDGLVRCGNMPAARNRVYIISDYRTIEDFVAVIASTLHKSEPRWRVPEYWARMAARMTAFMPHPLTEQRINAMVKRAIYSTARIEADLGYRHLVPMEDGLRQLVMIWADKNKR
ncbi:MAG: NAD-dependent epimerase/dehydratase family protein [Sulfuricella sp.]|nr:NAD-dependent epimerase/dehydratase family protein [Sulfuricella sp.]